MRLLFSFLLFTFSFASIAQIPSYVPTNGLVGWWPFNGNANDESGNGNNGVVNGATLITDRFGNANRAYSFNGSSNYIVVPNSNSLQNISSITISAWININQLYQSGDAGFYPIVSKSDQQGIYGNYAFGFWSPNIIGHLNYQETATAFPFNFGNWQYVSFVVSNNTTTFYLNGQMLWTGNSGVFPNNPINSMPLIFGMDRPGFVEYANGKIDDIAIYNRALTQTEITQLYTSTITPPTPEDTTSNVGIGTITPKRKLHVNDVMRLEPRNSAPSNPGEGDIYYDAILKKIRYYNGTSWISL